LRYGYWPSGSTNGRGTVVVLGGRTEFVEKYHETIQDLLVRGYNVYSMDWRGQGLSERLLKDPVKGYVKTYEHYISDLAWFLDKVVFERHNRPLIVLAHSMGANILLHFLKQFPERIDKAILMAPMVDIQTYPMPRFFVRQCSQFFVRLGLDSMNIPALIRKNDYHRPFRANWLTHDLDRYHRVQQLIKQNSRLLVTSITFGWLAATYKAIDQLHQPGYLSAIHTPLLLVVAGRDRIVCNRAIRYMATQLSSCQLEIINGAHHEILQERDTLRGQFWQAFERFV
jgi:lysophospholipase